MRADNEGRWDDVPCSVPAYTSAICQKELGPLDPPIPTQDSSPPRSKCPGGRWSYYAPTNKCFYVFQNGSHNVRFNSFEMLCRQVSGGHAASIWNQQENDFILNFAKRILFPAGIPNFAAHSELSYYATSVWIGYHSITRTQHQFTWVDGSNTGYTNWMRGTPGKCARMSGNQPDNYAGSQFCTRMTLGGPQQVAGTWDDVECTGSVPKDFAGGVCQIQLATPPAHDPPRTESPPKAADETPTCPHGWTPYNATHDHKCYKIVKSTINPVTFNTQRKSCRNADNRATLATIETEHENNFVYNLARKAVPDNHGAVWIGLQDAHRDRVWTWIDGTKHTYRKWDKVGNQPDNHWKNQYCVFLQLPGIRNGMTPRFWDDAGCANRQDAPYAACHIRLPKTG